jgi:hypothetical protein
MLYRLRDAELNPKLQTSGLRILVFAPPWASPEPAGATRVRTQSQSGVARRGRHRVACAAIIAGLALTAFSHVMARFANAWVLATERQRGEGNDQMDDTLSRGAASAGTALPTLLTKGVVE